MYCTTLTFLCKKVSEAGGLGIMIKELSCPKNVQEEGKKRVAAALCSLFCAFHSLLHFKPMFVGR